MKLDLMKYVPEVVSSNVARQLLLAQKHSPAILFGVGVVGVVATVVLASRATLRLEEVIEESEKQLYMAEEQHTSNHVNYSDVDYKKDLAIIYTKSALSVTKLYGPTIIVGFVSIGCLAGSHHILTTRNAGLMAAYAAVEKAFVEYRQRVTKELGPEKDREFRYGVESHEVVEDTAKGPKVALVKRAGSGEPSMYARLFDSNTRSWQSEPMYNAYFLRSKQNYANDLLHARGHVFLNDVYDDLGLSRTAAGAVVGWYINKENKNDSNYIDFGIFDPDNPRARDFMNARDGAILLDFNVDGVIYDKI